MANWWDDCQHPKWDELATGKQQWLVATLQRELGRNETDTSQMTKREISALIVQLRDAITMAKIENGEIDIYGLRG